MWFFGTLRPVLNIFASLFFSALRAVFGIFLLVIFGALRVIFFFDVFAGDFQYST